jgi:hypothetical protein
MKTWTDHEHGARACAVCASCSQPIVLVPGVGWVLDLRGADTYDLCETNPFGNHMPAEASDAERIVDR